MKRRTGSTQACAGPGRSRPGSLRTWIFGFVTLTLAAIVGCGGGTTEPPDPTAAGVTAEGWTAFEDGDMTTADQRFQDALDLDANYADAHTGRGWVAIRQEGYASATTHFAAALAQSSTAHDARAGRVLAEAALDHPQTVVDDGLALLAAQPAYSFGHDPHFVSTDIKWLVARAALDVGDYQTAADQINSMASLSSGEPLDPEAADFLEQALMVLDRIRDLV